MILDGISFAEINDEVAESVGQDLTAHMCQADLALHTPQFKLMGTCSRIRVDKNDMMYLCELTSNSAVFFCFHKLGYRTVYRSSKVSACSTRNS